MRYKRGYYDVFVQACAKYPKRIAVKHYIDGDYKNYTYSELYGVCEYTSQNLQQLQCTKGIIGIITARNPLVPSVLAATHKCCKTFMFIDPMQDIEKICCEIRFKLIISIQNGDRTVKVPYNKCPEKTINILDYTIKFYKFDCSTSETNFRYSRNHSFIALTSGSTGVPSQIEVPIQCLEPNISDLTKLFSIEQNDVVYFCTPLTFDPSMVEILLACTNGASLLIAPEKLEILFPKNRNDCITFWQTTPSKFFQHSDIDISTHVLSENSSLRILALGGEPLNGIKRLTKLKNKENKTRIFTLYGVTEMSCWACAAELNLNKMLTDREVPLGNCLSETRLIVEPINKKGQSGKIMLASDTRKCIILNNNKHKTPQSSSVIDTGDLALLRDGIVYYAGRTDDIIKRFGHKVNLQFIETVVMQCPEIKSCSCVWLPKPLLLVVYFTSDSLNSQELANFLKCKLDDKHWPDNIIRVESLPMTAHGKVSRLLLSEMYGKDHKKMSLTDLKKLVLEEICRMLNNKYAYEDIKHKTFYSIGGTSFLAMSMCNKLSVRHPELAKFLLPHFLTQNASIDEIIVLAHKEICEKNKKIARTVKRSLTNATGGISHSKTSKKNGPEPNNQVYFSMQWSYDTHKCVDASPTLFHTERYNFVTVGSHSGEIVVIDAVTGILQGKITLKSRIEASVLCFYLTPDVVCGAVGTYDGTIVCFKLQDCSEIWKININSMIKSKMACGQGMLYVAAYDGKIRSIDTKTGVITHTIAICEQAISADLVLAKNGYLLVGSLSGVVASVAVGSTVWHDRLASPVFAAPALYAADKYVLFAEVNGEIHCRTVEKGLKVWRYKGAKGNIFSSLLIEETGKLKRQAVFGCHDSNVYSINIENFQPHLNWKSQLSAEVYATPCKFGDKIFIAASSNGKLNLIESENGKLLGEYQLPDKIFSSPVIYGNNIFIGCRDDNLYCLKIDLKL